MRFCYFYLDGGRHFGLRTNDGFLDLDVACRDYYAVRPVKNADPNRFRDLRAFLAGGADSATLASSILEYIENRRKSGWTHRAATGERFYFRSTEKVAYLPPILPGAKILSLRSNHAAHAREQGLETPKRPQAVARFTNTLSAHDQSLFLMAPDQRPEVDLELGVVMGATARRIPREQALEHVAGFATVMSVGYRGLEYAEGGAAPDWVLGRGLDYSLSVGPGIVARDEVPDPKGRKMELKVNGVVRQAGSTDEYLFSAAEAIHQLSQGITLEFGDLITLGSMPSAPGFEAGKPERTLRAGDVIEGTIEGIGTLKNTVVAEPAQGAPLRGN